MKYLRILILVALLFFCASTNGLAAQSPTQYITMHIPGNVIETALAKSLPLTFQSDSDRLEGTVTVVKISRLKLTNKTVLCHLELHGKDLNLITSVANQVLRLKLGEARVDFDCETTLRYDASRKTLFLRPIAQGVQAEQALQDGDIGKALLMLLNGREFPVELQDIEPIIAEASNKTIIITPRIADINAINGAVQISLLPGISANPK